MIGVVVAAHDGLAKALVVAAQSVVPQADNVVAVDLNPEGDANDHTRAVSEAIAGVDTGAGVLLLTDMFGGTPANIGMSLHSSGKVEVLTGANLPMVIKAAQAVTQDKSLADTAESVQAAGHRSIAVASELLNTPPPPPEETP